METKISNGDYVPDGLGGVARCKGTEALLERVLFLPSLSFSHWERWLSLTCSSGWNWCC